MSYRSSQEKKVDLPSSADKKTDMIIIIEFETMLGMESKYIRLYSFNQHLLCDRCCARLGLGEQDSQVPAFRELLF